MSNEISDERLAKLLDGHIDAAAAIGGTSPAERDFSLDHVDAFRELQRLRAWKGEAMLLLQKWRQVWLLLGRPGALGEDIADASYAYLDEFETEYRVEFERGTVLGFADRELAEATAKKAGLPLQSRMVGPWIKENENE